MLAVCFPAGRTSSRSYSDINTVIGEDESGVGSRKFGGRHFGWIEVYATA